MSALAKVFVVFVFLLSISFFATSATLFLTREDWATKYETYRTEVTHQVDLLEITADTLKGERDTLDDALRQVPSFSLFRRTSSLAAHPTSQGVSLRGIGPSGVSRTLVLLDDKYLQSQVKFFS